MINLSYEHRTDKALCQSEQDRAEIEDQFYMDLPQNLHNPDNVRIREYQASDRFDPSDPLDEKHNNIVPNRFDCED